MRFEKYNKQRAGVGTSIQEWQTYTEVEVEVTQWKITFLYSCYIKSNGYYRYDELPVLFTTSSMKSR